VCIHQLVGLEPVTRRVTAQRPDVSFTLRFGFRTFSVEDLSQHRDYETYFGECGMQASGVLLEYPAVQNLAIRVSSYGFHG
jgi:hypothetical protein